MLLDVVFVVRIFFIRNPGWKLEVINTQLNAFLIESQRTITDIDMMVPTNLVGIVIQGFSLLRAFLNVVPFKR